ncbi:MAG TPA: ABC transporter ATP-binding protein [Rhodopila sp.]
MPDIVVAEHLVKRYGPRLAVRDVSFVVAEGEVVGLLGPNGSGKSTILRMLTGYLPPSEGTVRVGELDVRKDSLAVRRRIGYVPEDSPLYEGMRVSEFLSFMGHIKGLFGRALSAAVATACEQLQLERVFKMPIGKLSHGYRQRVAIAQALLDAPRILILDEPTNGLDAYQVIGIRELLRSLAGQRTVILASHVLSEIAKITSRVMILANGRLLTADAAREGGSVPAVCLCVAGPAPAVSAVLRNVDGVTGATVEPTQDHDDVNRYRVEFLPGTLVTGLLASTVVAHGFGLLELVEEKPDLEQAFLNLTSKAANLA